MGRRRGYLVACVLAVAGCPSEPVVVPQPNATVQAPRVPAGDLLVIPFRPDSFSASPNLLARVTRSPFGYFRYTNEPFIRAVCRTYADTVDTMPTVNLHGDAHVEQYAVAADGRGLADFDAATLGPPIIDLARFATSLALASTDVGGAEQAIAAFLRGYSVALDDPAASGAEPAVATRIRATFAPTAGEWLDATERLMTPMDDEKKLRMESAKAQYVTAILSQNPDLTQSFFELKRGGLLKMGLGSAHEMKFLGRFEGPTATPEDDVILEMKQMAPMPADTCIRGRDRDPLRVVVGQSRLAMSPQRFLGYVDVEGKTFYVHAWRVHYTELGIGDIHGADELAQVAYDVGLQLGKGHPKNIADPHGASLRAELKALVREVGPTLPSVAKALAAHVVHAHEVFTREADLAAKPPQSP